MANKRYRVQRSPTFSTLPCGLSEPPTRARELLWPPVQSSLSWFEIVELENAVLSYLHQNSVNSPLLAGPEQQSSDLIASLRMTITCVSSPQSSSLALIRPRALRNPHRNYTCRPHTIPCAISEVTQVSFQKEVLKADLPVVVDFWATWCGPCKLIDVVLKKLAAEEGQGKIKVVKMDVDSCQELVAEYKVYGLPTLILFKDGKVVEGSKREGAIGKSGIISWLKNHGVSL